LDRTLPTTCGGAASTHFAGGLIELETEGQGRPPFNVRDDLAPK
jgi:hypothetical protein